MDKKPISKLWNEITYREFFYAMMIIFLCFIKIIYKFYLWLFKIIKRMATKMANKNTIEKYEKIYGKV